MKRMMTRACFASLLFLVINMHALADTTLPGVCEVAQPQILLQELLSEKDIQKFFESGDWGQSAKTDKPWVVYSDRENNTTYNSPDKTSGRFAQLKFNQQLRIAKISGNFALVYEEQMGDASHLKINNGKTYGWVPMENLLLWSSCPTNDIGIYNKALPVMNIDEYLKNKNDAGRVYKNPEQKSSPTRLMTGMNFYFIMKEDKKSGLILLSRECKMSGYTSNVLYGWVSSASFIKWNQRACLESNWNPEAAKSMANKGVTHVGVFRNINLTDSACGMPLGRTNDLSNKAFKYRMYPDEMRYPLLDNDKEKELYKVTAFATPDGKAHIAKVRDGNDKSFIEAKEKALKDASVINLIVVIDGTSSMKEFYNPAQRIIQQANQYFSTENKNVVRVGVVIYRDYPDGEGLTEYLPMTKPQDANLAKFLTTGGKYGIRSVAKSSTEALYKGLEVALDANKMGYNVKQSNLMFVIGDCGNDPEDKNCLTATEIVSRCAENRVQISAFQVYNGASQAYKLFRSQMGHIVRENLKLQYNVEKLKQTKDGETFKYGWQELPNGYEFKTSLVDDICYIGNTRNAKNGEKMPLTELYDIVKDSYIQFNGVVEYRKSLIEKGDNIIMIADESVSDRTAVAQMHVDFISRVFDKEDLAKVKEANMLMAFVGYVNKVDSKSSHDFWKPVIYISKDEFNAMMDKLQPVMAAAKKSSKNREPYINALKALIKVLVPDISENEMNNMSPTAVTTMVAGLPVTSEALQGRTLREIKEPQIVSQEEFDKMIVDFQDKFQHLDNIKENGYEFSIERNTVRWFWIPVEDLP